MTEQKEKRSRSLLYIGIALIALALCALLVFLILRTPSQQQPQQTTAAKVYGPLIVGRPSATAAETQPAIAPNPYTADDFGYDGQYMTCFAQESMLGVDVSKYQDHIDWEQVKQAGIEFVMIRVGGRGYGEGGALFADEMAQHHYKGAREAGLLIGAYFFSQAISVEEAIEEANLALELTKDWEMELPLVYDWEYVGEEGRTAYVHKWTLTDCALAFCQTVEAAGRDAMIYVSPWYGNLVLSMIQDYPHWVALYKDEMTYKHSFVMWQYTCTGSVPGIKGDVDLNVYIP